MPSPESALPEFPVLHFPVTIIVDTREGRPYSFGGIRADADHAHRRIIVNTERKALNAGDYSLAGWEGNIAIERKSLDDLYGTLGQQRERFVRELERLQENGYTWSAVVVEASWEAILSRPPSRSYLKPKTVYRSILAWMQRYPRVHWITAPDRQFAEVTTFRLLERWIKDHRPGRLYE